MHHILNDKYIEELLCSNVNFTRILDYKAHHLMYGEHIEVINLTFPISSSTTFEF